ncbi:MAG: lysine transporter LysE [Firmicutes bacterium HGW-Firmicutes-13]|nr:MAG: lysine transporter LysE [Firmicutes bacterium HGW-Firmicutes-13]
MELILIFFTALVVGFSGAVVPGPLLTVTVNETLRRGIVAGPLLILGHAVLELGVTIGLVYGLSRILTHPFVGGIFGVLGGAVLIWMGTSMVKEARNGEINLEIKDEDKKVGLNPVAAGIVISLSNPYFVIWWGTIGAGYVIVSLQYGLAGVVFFFLGHILADFIWYTFASWLVVVGTKKISPQTYRGLTGACGVFLIGLAVFFLYSGLNFFFFS